VGYLFDKFDLTGAGITKSVVDTGAGEKIVFEFTAGQGGTAATTVLTPTGNIAATNVQDAISELDSEKADAGPTHPAQTASSTAFTPAGGVQATTVQGAIQELDSEKSNVGHTHAPQTAATTAFTPSVNISANSVQAAIEEVYAEKASATHGHAASEVTFSAVGGIAATDVQAAIAELDSEKSNVGHTHAAQSATDTPFTASGSIAASNVQGAIQELDSEKADVGHTHPAPNAADVVFTATAEVSATTVAAAIAEIYAEKQPLNSQLTSVGSVGVNGFLARTATNTVTPRTLTAGSSKVAVTNGDGAAGNPTVDVTEANLSLNNIGGTLGVAKGGTGKTTLTANSVLVGAGTGAVGEIAPSTSGNVLTSNGTAWVSSPPASGGSVTSINGQTGAVVDTALYAIGSFVRGRPKNGTSYAANSTVAGSSLWATEGTYYPWNAGTTDFLIGIIYDNGGALAPNWITVASTLVNVGTWRCITAANNLGTSVQGDYINSTSPSMCGLWVRIS
jgi:hypothetical protein